MSGDRHYKVLVEVAKAAREKRKHENNRPVLLDDQTYEDWAVLDRCLGQILDAKLAPLVEEGDRE